MHARPDILDIVPVHLEDVNLGYQIRAKRVGRHRLVTIQAGIENGDVLRE